jgi:hypothetical protein
MRLSRMSILKVPGFKLRFPATHKTIVSPATLGAPNVHTKVRFFCLTILFADSIQRTNCDDVMSQASMKMEKGE